MSGVFGFVCSRKAKCAIMGMKMDDPRERISKHYVAVRTDGDPPPNSVETLRDAGSTFAVIPVDPTVHDQLGETFPVLTIPGSDSFEVATGAVTLRWNVAPSDIASLLEASGVKLVRNYGVGGVVLPVKPEHPFDLADRLRKLQFVTSASAHTIRRAEKR